jgi:hypothetical protein
MKEILECYYSWDFNLIPIPRGRKGAIVKWKQYEETKAPKIPDDYDGNLAVVLGKTSGNLIDVDADSKDLLDLLIDILPTTLTTKSYRGGHFYYRTDFPIRKFILDLGAHGKLELAGQGQISILPPSIHPQGTVYEFLRKVGPSVWHGDFRQELTQLLEKHLHIKTKPETIDIKKILKGVAHGERDKSAIIIATYYRKRGLVEDQVIEKLHDWNKINKPPYGEHPTDKLAVDKWIQLKVESAFKSETPYNYRFKKEKKETKYSCGEDLDNVIFEQTNEEFIVYDKNTGKITKQKTFEDFKPFDRLVWKPVDDVLPYESEQQLWNEIRQYLWEHIDITEGYDVLTAWVLASWTPEKWHAVPYLFFYGAPGSGKTWSLEVLASIGFRPFLTAATTLPVIFRAVDQWHPTLYLDETEAYMRKERGEILHLLNAGYRKGFPATRIEETQEGFRVRVFDCFGFKALAGTKEFAKALKSRCIILNMSKATRKIKTKIDSEKAQELRQMLLMYRFKMLSKKAQVSPPEVLTGRLKELFDPLIVVAPETAKQSIIDQAKKIEETTEEEERTSDEALVFKAVYDIFQAEQPRKITIEKITQLVNENLAVDDQISNVQIGMTLSRLGFKRTLCNGKRAICWDIRIAERLVKRYLTASEAGGLTAFDGDET